MHWNDCKGCYKAFISLGTTCQTAYQLKRQGLRRFAGPLDWFISPSVPGIIQLIRGRFNGFMDFNRLQLHGATQDCYVVRDTAFTVDSYHDFPLHATHGWWEGYHGFKEQMNRRVDRLLKTMQRGPICFVRTETSKQDAQKLYAALTTLARDPFRLLIVNHHTGGLHDVRHENWGMDRVGSVTVPKGADWRGSDPAWDHIMKGFKLA